MFHPGDKFVIPMKHLPVYAFIRVCAINHRHKVEIGKWRIYIFITMEWTFSSISFTQTG